MRISDWSSDVCSSDLVARPCSTSSPKLLSRCDRCFGLDRAMLNLEPITQRLRDCFPLRIGIRVLDEDNVRVQLCRSRRPDLKVMAAINARHGGDDGRTVRASHWHMGTQRDCGDLRSEEHTSELQSLMRIS